MDYLHDWCSVNNRALGTLLQPTSAGGIVEYVSGCFYVIEWARGFCHEIGAHSPAVAVANIGCVHLLNKVVATVKFRLGLNEEAVEWCPTDSVEAELWLRPIFSFLHQLLNRSVQDCWSLFCTSACVVLEDLAQVCFTV
jgi:hypothetical protein